MHECEAIVVHCFGDLFFTPVYVVLCIIVNIGIMEGTKLSLNSQKAALLLKRRTATRSLYMEPFISLSTTSIQNFSLL